MDKSFRLKERDFSNFTDYETIAVSQLQRVLGPVGATGDVLKTLILVPVTTSATAVLIEDGSDGFITIFTGGGTLTDLTPIVVNLGIRSVSGAWNVTTGTNITVLAIGEFT